MEKISIVKRRKVNCNGKARPPLEYPAFRKPVVREPVVREPARVVSIELTAEQAKAVRDNGRFQQRYGLDASHIVFNLHMDDVPGPRMLTPKMLCEMLQVSRHTLSKLVRDGALRSYKIGRLRRFSCEDVIDYLSRSLTSFGMMRLRVEQVARPDGENRTLPA